MDRPERLFSGEKMDFSTFLYSIECYCADVLTSLGTLSGFVLFCPLVLYEAMRYCLPVPWMLFRSFCGREKDDSREKEEFLKTNPSVSIIIAGRNEAEIIADTLDSLLALPYQNREILVIDDNSTDRMEQVCREYEKRGLIRLIRNDELCGRVGRPVASNIGLYYAKGEFIISLDADTSYDRNMIAEMIGPFYDPRIGVVAGNLKIENVHDSIWTVCQYMEYSISIGIWKRWTSQRHVTLQASGAFGAFRREALLAFNGWDPELAEDADISLKMRRAGWDIAFSPYAIAMTHAPASLIQLIRQRIRWDKGAVRTYFHKHRDMMIPWKSGNARFSIELLQEFFMIYLLPLVYLFYTAILLYLDWKIWVFAQVFCYGLYLLMTGISLAGVLYYSERREMEWFLLSYIPFFPVYKEIFRWVRIYANLCETFRWKSQETYLPKRGYFKAPW